MVIWTLIPIRNLTKDFSHVTVYDGAVHSPVFFEGITAETQRT